MKIGALLAVLLAFFAVVPAHASAMTCGWQVTLDIVFWIPYTGWVEYIEWTYLCSEEITVTAPPPAPTEPDPPTPPPPYPPPVPPSRPPSPAPSPTVVIRTANDSNPSDVVIAIDSLYADSMSVYANGGLVYNGSPAPNVHVGRLDSFSAINSTYVTVQACSATAGCVSDAMYISRTTSAAQADGQVVAAYYDFVPNPSTGVEIKRGLETWQRIVNLDVIYTEYTVATAGDRNGRVFHRGMEDEIYWSGNTQRWPIWEAEYRMTPSWLPALTPFTESTGNGCYPYISSLYSDTKCVQVSQFALASSTQGTAVITLLKGSGSAPNPELLPPVGDLNLTVLP